MDKKLKILELFAGSRCFAKEAERLGHETFSSDILALEGIDYAVDIFEFDCSEVPFIPDLIWASPDCAAWSRAAGVVHFETSGVAKPKTEKAKKAFLMIEKTLEIIAYFLLLNPDLKFYIENPVGKLQYVDFMRPDEMFCNPIIKRMVRIDQCQYGREYMKPTHIWTNDSLWKERGKCKGRHNGCTHLENIKNVGDKYDRVVKNLLPGKRRSSLGILDKGGYYKRAAIPADLCREIIEIQVINN